MMKHKYASITGGQHITLPSYSKKKGGGEPPLYPAMTTKTVINYIHHHYSDRMQDKISVSVRILNDLSKHLRARRFEAGALALASPEVKFQRDRETQDPIDVDILSCFLYSFNSPFPHSI